MIEKKHLLLLILFSMIFINLSVLILSQVSPLNSHCDIDSKAYIEKADLLYKTGSFAPTPAYQNIPYYALGYPMFIALIYKIFGQSLDIIIFVQIFLALLAAFLIFITAKRLFNQTVGILAFALTCINIGFLTFAQFILTENLLSLFLILFFERFTAYLYSNKPQHLAQAAIALGLSIIIKPAALYYPILLIPLILYTNKANRLKLTLLFLSCFALPVLCYMAHNKAVFNQFKIANLDTINIYFWFYPNVLAHQHGTTSDIERLKLQFISGPDNSNIDFIKEMFKKDLQQKPFLFAYIWLKNVLKTFLGLFTTNLKVLVEPQVHGGDISFFKMHGTLFQKAWLYIEAGATTNWLKFVGLSEAIWSIIRFVLCLLALFTIFYQKNYVILYFITSYIFYFSMITGHDGCARFRMLFEFVLIILAAMGLWILFAAQKKESHEPNLLCCPCRG